MKNTLSKLEHTLADLQCILIARRIQASDEPMRLHWRHFDILGFIKQHAVVTPTDISDALHISKSSTSKYLKHLHRNGLIKKARTTSDGRSYEVSLTETAHVIMDNIYKGWRDNALRAAEALTPHEIMLYTELSAKIIKALDDSSLHKV